MAGTGRIVLVSGGGGGIGRAICRAFAVGGNAVIINYRRSREAAESLRDELVRGDCTAYAVQADVTDYGQVATMVDSVVERHGRIDVLVNNAGITRDGFVMLMPQKDWHDVINTNLTGAFNCSKAAIGHMIAMRGGVIINMASLSGMTGLPGQANYSAAKGGVIAFTKALAREVGPFGIRVNAVAPGAVETEMTEALPEKVRTGMLQSIPMKRFGLPGEVASAVRFLASPEADYITGESIVISGGLP